LEKEWSDLGEDEENKKNNNLERSEPLPQSNSNNLSQSPTKDTGKKEDKTKQKFLNFVLNGRNRFLNTFYNLYNSRKYYIDYSIYKYFTRFYRIITELLLNFHILGRSRKKIINLTNALLEPTDAPIFTSSPIWLFGKKYEMTPEEVSEMFQPGLFSEFQEYLA
jgi:hypothetical protein